MDKVLDSIEVVNQQLAVMQKDLASMNKFAEAQGKVIDRLINHVIDLSCVVNTGGSAGAARRR